MPVSDYGAPVDNSVMTKASYVAHFGAPQRHTCERFWHTPRQECNDNVAYYGAQVRQGRASDYNSGECAIMVHCGITAHLRYSSALDYTSGECSIIAHMITLLGSVLL